MLFTWAVLLSMSAVPGGAQQPKANLTLDLSGGVSLPVGDADKAATIGPALAIGLNHGLGDGFLLVTEFHHSAFMGSGLRIVETTDLILSRVSLGVERRVTSSAARWKVSARLMGGVTRVVSDPVRSQPGQAPTDFGISKINTDSFSLTGGIQVARRLGRLTPFLRTQLELHFVGSNLGALRGLDESISESGPIIGIPVQVGVRFGL